jgi:hypothetical protein
MMPRQRHGDMHILLAVTVHGALRLTAINA